jgi:multicomponent Na+:H+ antiporter subunit G
MIDYSLTLVLGTVAGDVSLGMSLFHLVGVILGILGLAFFFGSAVGMVRFPDFYTRMHAAGKGDTLSTMLMLAGFAMVTMDDFSLESWLVFIKILAVILFIYLTTPTSSHALMRAAFEDDEMPMTEEDLKNSTQKKKSKK